MAVLIIFPHMLQNGGPTPFCHITITKTKINNNNNQFHTWTHIWWLLIRQCIKLYFLYARASIAIACISYGNSVLMVAVTSRYRSKPKWDRDHGFLRAKAALLSARLSHRNFVCLSVRLSVTRVDQSKTMQARITKSSPMAAWKTLVLGTVKFFYKFEGRHPEQGC